MKLASTLSRTGSRAGLGLTLLTVTAVAYADEIGFGTHDVASVFFIDKSDDHNRVDYGIRLTADCVPASDDAVFPYWREFEHQPVRTHGLSTFEWIPFGFSQQRTVQRTPHGGVQLVRLKQLDRIILIRTERLPDGHCSAVAHARIASVDGATLVSVFAKKAGAMSVDYVDIHGKTDGAADIVERVRK